MPFQIMLTYPAQRKLMRVLLCTLCLTVLIHVLGALHPALLRLVFLWVLLTAWLSPRLRSAKWQGIYWGVSVAVWAAFFFWGDGYVRPFIQQEMHEPASQMSQRSNAELIDAHLGRARTHLLFNMQRLAEALWPRPLQGALSMGMALLMAMAWPRLRRRILAALPNARFSRWGWSCERLPQQVGRYLYLITLRGLIFAGFWGIGLYLLGFKAPLAPALLMGAAAATPFWGALIAALLSLFFVADVLHLPFQIIGATIVFAVTWLAAYFLLPQHHLHAPPLPKGVSLIVLLLGIGLYGLFGLLFAVPLVTLSLILLEDRLFCSTVEK